MGYGDKGANRKEWGMMDLGDDGRRRMEVEGGWNGGRMEWGKEGKGEKSARGGGIEQYGRGWKEFSIRRMANGMFHSEGMV